MNRNSFLATGCAILAAVFYAVNMPASKLLLQHVGPTMMAALLYLGAGIGIGALFFVRRPQAEGGNLRLSDLPYTIGMILLDIAAPIFLMFGLLHTTSASASLLNNFEIVATSLIALLLFGEAISRRLWLAIALVTLSSVLLSVEDFSQLKLSWGALLVLCATLCWGLENNCTRKISNRNTYEIVMLKGIFSGLGSFVIALCTGEALPSVRYALLALLVGFVAYGLSIFFYIRAQRTLGAAKTSAYYAIAPFVGALLSLVLLHEALTAHYFAALVIMLLGSALVAADTVLTAHTHTHTHTITHTHDGSTHTHVITHSHAHIHAGHPEQHTHTHILHHHHPT